MFNSLPDSSIAVCKSVNVLLSLAETQVKDNSKTKDTTKILSLVLFNILPTFLIFF